MNFEFATATRIVFGAGKLAELGALGCSLGRRALVVSGSRPAAAERIAGLLREAEVIAVRFVVAAEPTVTLVEQGTRLAREAECDFVIAIGGGSVIDAGKAIAAMLANDGELLDYVEVIGRGRMLSKPSRPFIAIPTTAGTGAEVTRNSVLAAPDHRVKVSLRSLLMLPALALVDPELTYDLPPALTASTGLDALTQLIEPFTSNRANPLTDTLCREGMLRVARSLRLAYHNGENAVAREGMAVAGLFGGLALANAGLGAAHGFAAPIGGMFSAPHGAVCAALLPHVMAMNIRALERKDCSCERYDEVARILTGSAVAVAADGVRWVSELTQELNIPKLNVYGIAPTCVPELVAKATNASSMKANPVVLNPGELSEVLLAAL
ncbi:MAG: iron-containing alcohol dehydrogenase [Verrucomicrobiota bacterium]